MNENTRASPTRALFYGRHFEWIARTITRILIQEGVPQDKRAQVMAQLILELEHTNVNFNPRRFRLRCEEVTRRYAGTESDTK